MDFSHYAFSKTGLCAPSRALLRPKAATSWIIWPRRGEDLERRSQDDARGGVALEIRFGSIRVRPHRTLSARPNFWQRADAGECVQIFESRPAIPQLVADHIAVWRGCRLAGGQRGRRRHGGRRRGENNDGGRGRRAEKNGRVVTRPVDVRMDTTVVEFEEAKGEHARWASFARRSV